MSTGNDYIDNERHRKPARKVAGDPRPGSSRRKHPPRPGMRGSYWKAGELVKKYQALASKYSELSEQARGADYDDAHLIGSDRSEPIPSETVYTLMADLARMIVKDLKEQE